MQLGLLHLISASQGSCPAQAELCLPILVPACHAFMKLLTLDRDHGEKSDDAFASLSCHIRLIIKLMIPDRDFQKMSLTRDHRFLTGYEKRQYGKQTSESADPYC